MDVLILLLFVGIILATCGVAFFAWNVQQHNHEHGARLALLPLELETTDEVLNIIEQKNAVQSKDSAQ